MFLNLTTLIFRYYAILYPLSNQNKWLTQKSQYILGLSWVLGVAWASMPNTKIVELKWNNETYLDCRPDENLYKSRWWVVSFEVRFSLPPRLMFLQFLFCPQVQYFLSNAHFWISTVDSVLLLCCYHSMSFVKGYHDNLASMSSTHSRHETSHSHACDSSAPVHCDLAANSSIDDSPHL